MILTVTLNPALDKILVVDKIIPRTTVRANEVIIDIGGKGTHVAWVLGKMGYGSTALGLLAGETGKKIEGMLKDVQVNTDFLWLPGESRNSIIVMEVSTGSSLMFAERGFDVEPKYVDQLLAQMEEYCPKAVYTVISGGVPPTIRTSVYAEMVQVAKGAGSKTILDASGQYLQEGIKASPWLVKPNQVELNQIYGTHAETIQDLAALGQRVLQDFGITWLVVSLAERGCLVLGPDTNLWVQPPEVKEINSVGCGDVFLAGLTARLNEGVPMEAAVIFASALGATKAATMGTATHDVEWANRMLDQVKVINLDGGDNNA